MHRISASASTYFFAVNKILAVLMNDQPEYDSLFLKYIIRKTRCTERNSDSVGKANSGKSAEKKIWTMIKILAEKLEITAHRISALPEHIR